MERPGSFEEWLRKFLESEGRFPPEQLAVWQTRADRKGVSFAVYLESARILTTEELQQYFEKYKRVARQAGQPEDAIEEPPLLIKDGILQPGALVGGYKILGVIGVGGMGVVYRAVQLSLQREVALKLLKPELSPDEEYRRRFLNESKMAAELSHKNIVRAYESGQIRNFLFFSMELVDGPNYEHLLDRNSIIAEPEALRVTAQVCSALAHAGSRGIVHADIKPANILRAPDGSAKLADLGLAKRRVDSTHRLFGTYHYMSPEAISGSPVDTRSDIYSLGATLFHFVTGVPPFSNLKREAILDAHLNEPIPDPLLLNPELSPDTARLIQQMMRKSPMDRPRDPGELAKRIEAMLSVPSLEEAPAPRRPASSVSRPSVAASIERKRSSSNTTLLLLFLFVVLGGAVLFFVLTSKNSNPTPTQPRSVAPSHTPPRLNTPARTPDLRYFLNAQKLYKPDEGNYEFVLSFIESKLAIASPEDKANLTELKDLVLGARDRRLNNYIDGRKAALLEQMSQQLFRDAFKAAQEIELPAKWGFAKGGPEHQRVEKELLKLVISTFEKSLTEADEMIAGGEFEKADALIKALEKQVLPGFDRQVVNLALKLADAKKGKPPIDEEAPVNEASMAAMKAGISRLLETYALGDSREVEKVSAELLASKDLAPVRDDVRVLVGDMERPLSFWKALYDCWTSFADRDAVVEMRMQDGRAFKGKMARTDNRFFLKIMDNGVEISVGLRPPEFALSELNRFSKLKGVDLDKDFLILSLLQAGRGMWGDAAANIAMAENTAERDRWIARFALVSPAEIPDVTAKDGDEKAAKELFDELLSAFTRGEWPRVKELATVLTTKYANTRLYREKKEAIEEMLKIAGTDAGDLFKEPVISKFVHNFRKNEDRQDFFHRSFGGDIGNMGFDNQGFAFVDTGADSLLLYRRSIRGDLLMSFDMKIEKGSELRVAVRNDRLGGGLQFTSEGFGLTDMLLTKYKYGGRKVEISWAADKLKVTVDGKQTEEYKNPGSSNEYVGFYFFGKGAKVNNIGIEAILGPQAAEPRQILGRFDIIYFADIRRQLGKLGK